MEKSAQMIARAWMDDDYRASLLAQGIHVPVRPDDLVDDRLDVLADPAGEHLQAAAPTGWSTCT